MTFRDAMDRIELARRITPVRDRTRPWGYVEYSCSCGTGVRVLVCNGVGWRDPDQIAPPDLIQCPGCGDETLVRGRYTTEVASLSEDVSITPYMRVPSHRAAIVLAREGVACAQLVHPTDSTWST